MFLHHIIGRMVAACITMTMPKRRKTVLNHDVQAAAEERAAAAEARELETVRLRAQQQRAADTQAQIDELRARRCAPACRQRPASV